MSEFNKFVTAASDQYAKAESDRVLQDYELFRTHFGYASPLGRPLVEKPPTPKQRIAKRIYDARLKRARNRVVKMLEQFPELR